MSTKKYTIGVDFGTLSGRAVLIDVANGSEVASAVKDYTHAVMDRFLPDGKTALGMDWALQHPQDYLEVLNITIPAVLKQSGIAPADVIGVAIDFTACTMIATKADGTPLCFLKEFEHNPNAWIKLWKHHAAQDKADELNRIAKERGETFPNLYGGKISSEWMLPKIWQVIDESPEVYAAADRFMESADWVIWQLTGNERRNACTAGYKAIWHKKDGYPSKDFMKALHPGLENVVADKLSDHHYAAGHKAGEITPEAAKLTGLAVGTAVAVANVDAHVSVPAVGITTAGKILAIMGTSTCHMLLGTEEHIVPGMCGVVEDGILEGFQGYEAGQSCVGDHFQWFVENCVPESYEKEARDKKISIHQLLTEKAAALEVGESGLVALDWWNGNRSVLVDVDLTGLLIGVTLQTSPEEIYRALIEATAYGTRMIIDTFRSNGVAIDEFYACGGIAEKNSLIMQIYSDVVNMPIKISASSQTPALGSAIFAALAAGKKTGGYDTIEDAVKAMVQKEKATYYPNAEASAVYNELYHEYAILHDYFGRGENPVMKKLKKIRKQVILKRNGNQ